jgi:hypothetical protein
MNRISLLLFFFAAIGKPQAQEYFRFKSEFSIKEKESDQERGRLVMGTVYYDLKLHKTAYHIRFPEREQWLVRDTLMYRILADTLASQRIVAPVGEFSIFAMILSQQMTDFGLSKIGYTAGEVTQDGSQVLSRWLPPAQFKEHLGAVVLAQEQKRLKAAAFYDSKDKLVSKFYFQDYELVEGLPVPGKVYQIFYRETGEFVRIMALKNVAINQSDEENRYDFDIPVGN